MAYALDPKVDRYVLEHGVFPALLARPDVLRVLFVGCDWYTRDYPDIFAGRHFQTIDVDPAKARFGSADHVVGSMTDLDEIFAPSSYDAIVANGVIGFGLDDPAGCERAVAACSAVLRPGGWLVLGWNDVDDLRPVRLEDLAGLRAFEAVPLPPFPAPRHPTFSPAHHTFDFYRRPPAGRAAEASPPEEHTT
jgi:SAM-dependent methyltransferase